jgi:rubrerythrin
MKVFEHELNLIKALGIMAHDVYFTKKELAESISRQLGVTISTNEFGRWLQIMDETKGIPHYDKLCKRLDAEQVKAVSEWLGYELEEGL